MVEMDVRGPLRVAILRWRPLHHVYAATIVCKATFVLRPGESVLSAEADGLQEQDNHWDDDPSRSVYAPCDLYPTKPRADVVLVGSAFAPGQRPVRELVTRMAIAGIDKSVRVCADRAQRPDGEIVARAAFAKMPLRYERAAGGPDTSNPVGLRADAPPDAAGLRPLPNLEPVAPRSMGKGAWPQPIGFGPIAPSWPTRSAQVSQVSPWPPRDWTAAPLPSQLDHCWFNVAPGDQQINRLEGTEPLLLENLHSEHGRLVTRLPEVSPDVRARRAGMPAGPVEMALDTLWIDTNRGVCSAVWRGTIALARIDEPLSVEGQLAPRTSQPSPLVGADASATVLLPGPAAPGGNLPFTPLAPGTSPYATPSPRNARSENPFGREADAGSAGQTVLGAPPAQGPTLPFPPGPRAGGSGLFPDKPPRTALLPDTPPAWVAPQPVEQPVRPAEPASPWAQGIMPAAARAPERAALPAIPTPAAVDVLSASNAAAALKPERSEDDSGARPALAATPRPAPSAAYSSVLVSFVWLDPQAVRRIRRHASFRSLLEELEGKPRDPDLDDPALSEDPMDIEDRRDVLEVLTRAPAAGADDIKEAIRGAAREDGKFAPPLLLCAGEFQMTFDETATLAAMIAAVTPILLPNDPLKPLIELTKEFLTMPGLLAAPPVTEALRKKLDEAFRGASRNVRTDYLDVQTERALVLSRKYQRRQVFGATHLRALLAFPGAAPVPVYLPETVASLLPLQARFGARFVAEAHWPVDPQDPSTAALRARALARTGKRQ